MSDTCSSVSERLEELDELTLEEYSHKATVQIGFLTNPSVSPEELEQALEWNFEDEIRDAPVAVEVEVTERSLDTGSEQYE